MAREAIPDFDLYGELEVSRHASVEVIDAAYRVLVKRHHPDVSQPMDGDRIKRINLAHNWLIDPARRRRYDNATQPPPTAPLKRGAGETGDEAAIDLAVSARLASKAFGPNTTEVRHFLADLRGLDELRAWSIRDGKATIDPDVYAAAEHAAFTIGQVERQSEWLLAREAASVIARGKLADAPLQAEITQVLANIAGAIVIRDRILPADFDLLMVPWTWRDDRAPAAAPVAVGRAGAMAARRSLVSAPVLALVGLVAVVAVAGIWSALTGSQPPGPAAAVDATNGPTVGATLTALASPTISAGPSASPSPSPFLVPDVTPSPTTTFGPTPTTAPGQTPRPSSAPFPTPRITPHPTPAPTPVPTPVPTPTPIPTPASCVVPLLIGVHTNTASANWTLAGFTTPVTFLDPLTKPPWIVGWQSLPAGNSVLCTSGISVARVAPTPSP